MSELLDKRLHFEDSSDIDDEGHIRAMVHGSDTENTAYGVWARSIRYGEPGKAAREVDEV